MLTFQSQLARQYCDGLSRRSFLQVGGLAMGGMTLANHLALQTHGAVNAGAKGKSVIMVCLGGGPSQLDMYDMKPDAPADIRGAFSPIRTNVAGTHICELMPRQAKLADKFSIVRNMTWIEPDHQRAEIFTGYPKNKPRPSFGSIVSRLYNRADKSLPGFVSVSSEYDQELRHFEQPLWAGASHRAFIPSSSALNNFTLPREVSLERLDNRKQLLKSIDRIRRDLDSTGEFAGKDAFTAQALEMITAPSVRDAFDLSKEKPETLARYGREGSMFVYHNSPNYWDHKAFIRARRLVEAGVPYVSLQVGTWDHHGASGDGGGIAASYRELLPYYDQCISALIEDLHERGLDKQVAVIVWGEFGRTPKVNSVGGRDHWPQAGCVLFAGGLKTGQIIGATDKTASAPTTKAYGPQNALATLYHFLGIDPETALTDFNGRPTPLLDDREPIAELV